jgi:RNA polymerase sigma factor (sigma-70 family)
MVTLALSTQNRPKAEPKSRQNLPIADLLDRKIEFIGIPEGRPPVAELQTAVCLADASRDHLARDGFSAELLEPRQEVEHFRAMNLLKAAAEDERTRARDTRRRATSGRALRAMDDYLAAAAAIRNRIVAANVRLVLATAKRFAAARLDRAELVSEGNFTLIRTVEKFDFSRGFRFSTYATWALRYHFQRMARRTADPLQNRVGGTEAAFDVACPETPEPAETANRRRWVALLDRLLDQLDPREQLVVRARFGLEDEEAASLNDVARRLGVCKERARQLQLRGLAKLKGLADAHRIHEPSCD